MASPLPLEGGSHRAEGAGAQGHERRSHPLRDKLRKIEALFARPTRHGSGRGAVASGATGRGEVPWPACLTRVGDRDEPLADDVWSKDLITGLLWPVLKKLRLPGDIVINRENSRFYFPIATSLVISVRL